MTIVTDPVRKHLHIYGVSKFDEVHLHPAEDGPEQGVSPAPPTSPSAVAPSPGSPEAVLARLKDYGNAGNVDTLYAGLLELGYEPNAPKVRKPGKTQEPYLRWEDPALGGTVLYSDTASAHFTRKSQREHLAGLPGAVAKAEEVQFSIKTAAGVGQALAAAEQVKTA